MRIDTKIYLLLLFALFLPSGMYAGDLDKEMAEKGLVDISTLDPSIQVSLKYSTTDNFMGEQLYDGLTKAWLHPITAYMLAKAQLYLKQEYPVYSLLIYDAVRPISVQKKMWKLAQVTGKTNYVSNPANGGGLHNYGMAVDLTIVDGNGNPLPMGTPFDFFGDEAHINNEEQLVATGKITEEAYRNRQLLRRVMRQAGFRTILYE
ncbi:MAG: M15 family metallopeptidase [Tannerellaceae bacterium]|nr:M15 family metallopeptidase [Tannerellaceae bacterium]MCD8263896.1 M15 family metallopeptidase [Tannerellaceae bacterium]